MVSSAIWLPTRPASEVLPAVTSVDLTLTRSNGLPTVRRTLGVGPATQLAAVVNAIPLTTPSVHSCPPSSAGTNRLVFHTAAGPDITLSTVVGGCGGRH